MFRIGIIQVLAILINIVRSKVTAVLLGPQGIGLVSVVDQVVQLAGFICAMSLPLAAIKILAHAHSEGKREFQRSYLGLLRILIILSFSGTTVVAISSLAGASWMGSDLLRFRPYLLIAAFNIPTIVLGGFFTNVLAAAGRVSEAAFVAVIVNGVMTIASYVGISLGKVLGLYAASAIAGLALTVGIIAFLRVRLDLRLTGERASVKDQLRGNRAGLLYSLMLYMTSLTYSGSLLAARYGVLHAWGDTEAGLLQSAMAIALALGLVLNPMNGLFLTPLMNRNTPPEEKLRTAVDFQKRLLVIMSLAAMALSMFPDLVIRILFSAQFASAAQSVPLLVFGQCLLQIAAVYQALLIGFDDLLMLGLLTAGGQLMFGAVSVWLTSKYGIGGVAAAYVISSFAVLASAFWRVRSRFALSLPGGTAVLMAYASAAIFFSGAIFRHQSNLHLAILSAKAGLYAAFTFGFFCFLSRQERESFYSMLPGVRSRIAAE